MEELLPERGSKNRARHSAIAGSYMDASNIRGFERLRWEKLAALHARIRRRGAAERLALRATEEALNIGAPSAVISLIPALSRAYIKLVNKNRIYDNDVQRVLALAYYASGAPRPRELPPPEPWLVVRVLRNAAEAAVQARRRRLYYLLSIVFSGERLIHAYRVAERLLHTGVRPESAAAFAYTVCGGAPVNRAAKMFGVAKSNLYKLINRYRSLCQNHNR